MVEIAITLIICAAFVACYWIHVSNRKEEGPFRTKPVPAPFEHTPMPFQKSEPTPVDEPADQSSLGMDGTIYPRIAQEYLDAAEKLEAEGRTEDMAGYVSLGNHRRKAAGVCRAKALKLIKEANV